MNEVTIPLKLTGVSSMKSELRALKAEIANATDPAQMEALARQAGVLADKIKDANEQVAVFTAGSKFEAVSNSFSMIGQDLASLDFEGASEKATVFANNLGKLNKADISKAIKGITSTVTTLGGAFVKLGLQILANPIFIITAVITAIVVAIGLFLNKIGVLDKVLQTLMIPINMLIQGFKDLTDWMGLTTYEAEAHAEKIGKANEKVQASSKKRSEKLGEAYDFEISKAKASGKDTTQLEIAKSKALEAEGKKRLHNTQLELNALQKVASKDNAEKRKKLKEQIEAEKKLIQNGARDRQLIAIQDAQAEKAQQQANYKAGQERRKENAKNRLDTERTIKDIELALIKDDAKREEEITKEKYKRLQADLITNDKITKDERARLKALYSQQELAELEVANQKILDAETAHAKKIADGIKTFNETEAQRKEDIAEINYQAGLTAQEKELEDERYKYEALLAEAVRYNEDSNNITEEYLAKKAEIEKKYTDKAKADKLAEIETETQVRNAKIQAVGDYGQSILNLGMLITKDQKKLEKINKASALIQIGIDTAMAISALVKASQQNVANGVTMGASGAIQFASGILQITSNMVKAKQLLSNPGGGVSAGGGGGGGGAESTTSVTQATPALQMFGQGNNLNSQGGTKSADANQNMMVTAVVSESDITNTQTKLSKLQRNAEL
jgi:hypothetical protein